ncbi:MAG: carboxypeptidase regulatory-like domain-containing protein [Acidobacteriota bacterium]
MRRLGLAIIFSILLVSATEIASPAQSDKPMASGLRGTQRTPTAQEKIVQSSESIRGRVIGEGGIPVADALISAFLVNPYVSQPPPVRSDADGKFELTDLKPGTYTISAFAEGYVVSDSSSKRLQTGESVTLTLVKSGVITGKLTNSSGNPVVGAIVRATKIREADNKPVRPHTEFTDARFTSPLLGPFKTDDRGIYRIYGLAPGYYQVAAGGPRGMHGFVLPVREIAEFGLYDRDALTYYPSSTLDTAVEVTVKAGDEVANIDIGYRDNRGHSISGAVSGPIGASQERINIVLSRASSGVVETITNAKEGGFAFESIVDGEYLVTARAGVMFGSGLIIGVPASPSRRVSVRGADVTGVEIVLEPLASIAGRVLIEPISAAQKAECKATSRARVEEVVISPRLENRQKPEDQSPGFFSEYRDTTANDKGEFALGLLRRGVHRIDLQLPAENLFIKSITRPAPKPDGKPIDAARNGIALKPGDEIKGLIITMSEGAGGLRGRVVTGKENKAPSAKMRMHLVPAEPEAVDNVLRYFEAEVAADGNFALANIAPGKYRLVARELSDQELTEADHRPLAWDAGGRTSLKFEGEASKKTIELSQCQRVTDLVLSYTPLIKPSKRPAKSSD